MGKRFHSLLFVLARHQCGHQSMTGLLCPQFPQMAGEGREGWSALVCTQLGVSAFLQGSALPQPPTFQELERTPLIGHSVPRTSQVPATPKGTTTSPSQTAELTLPRPCLCGSAPAPSTDQSVPAKSKRRPSQWSNNQAEPPKPPQNAPCRQTYLVLVIYNGESKHRHHSWGEKEHSVMFLRIWFLQRGDLLWWQTHYRATWSADPPGSFVLKMHFAQASQIWNSPTALELGAAKTINCKVALEGGTA